MRRPASAKHHVGQQARKVTTLDGLEFKKKLLAAKHPRTGEPLMPRTINAALIALKRCWNWAIDTESFGLVKNPFKKVKLLDEQGRQRIATDDEFRRLLQHSDALFRQVLLCLRFMPIFSPMAVQTCRRVTPFRCTRRRRFAAKTAGSRSSSM